MKKKRLLTACAAALLVALPSGPARAQMADVPDFQVSREERARLLEAQPESGAVVSRTGRDHGPEQVHGDPGRFGEGAFSETWFANMMGLVIFPLAIPWGHAVRKHIREPGDRWSWSTAPHASRDPDVRPT